MWKWAVLIRPIKQAWRDFQSPRVPLRIKLIPIAAVLYVLSPIDLIPDFFVAFGQLDDIGVVLLGLKLFMTLAHPLVQGSKNKSRPSFAQGHVIEEGDFEEI